jgi:hypothetical protein
MKKSIIILVLWSLATTCAFAGLERYAGEMGYVDLGDLRAFENGGEITEVIVGDNLINLVAGAVASDDPELGAMLRQLKLVHVHTFGVGEARRDDLHRHVAELGDRLDGEGWETLVRTRDGSGQSNVYLKTEGDQGIHGLCVLAVDSNHASFVNIVGSINMEALSRLGEQFEALDELEGMLEGVPLDTPAATNAEPAQAAAAEDVP